MWLANQYQEEWNDCSRTCQLKRFALTMALLAGAVVASMNLFYIGDMLEGENLFSGAEELDNDAKPFYSGFHRASSIATFVFYAVFIPWVYLAMFMPSRSGEVFRSNDSVQKCSFTFVYIFLPCAILIAFGIVIFLFSRQSIDRNGQRTEFYVVSRFAIYNSLVATFLVFLWCPFACRACPKLEEENIEEEAGSVIVLGPNHRY